LQIHPQEELKKLNMDLPQKIKYIGRKVKALQEAEDSYKVNAVLEGYFGNVIGYRL